MSKGFCYVAVGEDRDGLTYVSLATETSIWRLTVDDARTLAAQLVRVADLYEKNFKVEAVGKWSPGWRP